jgi:ParB family chromosome partitioning protein
MATNSSVKRAISNKEPVLSLSHDQVRFFKYHDRHESALDTAKVAQIRRSIESEGQHFPGIVRKTSESTNDGRMIYELIVGRLRFEASKGVGIFKAFLNYVDDATATKIMFAENEDRQDITPFERWLSVIPLLKDKVLEDKEIAGLIGWDKGNLSRSLKAIKVYDDCNLKQHLQDVSKVKMFPLTELSALYSERADDVKSAISFIEENYTDLKDSLFLKAVLKRVRNVQAPLTETVFLSGSKMKIKKQGESFTLSFKGIPKEADFKTVIATLKDLEALK